MVEFFRQNYRILTYSTEILAALTGVIFYKKYRFSNAKYFIWFLVYLTICEFLGGYNRYIRDDKFLNFLKGSLIEENYWWFTMFWKIGAILFFSFYYQRILSNPKFKFIIKYISYAFFAFSIIYIIFNWEDYFTKFFPAISIFGAMIIFLCTIFYFIETLQSDKILTFYKSLNFYISITIFIWWLIVTPLVFYDIYMSNRDWNFILLRWQIYLSANIFMYSTFTFALIFCKPENDKGLIENK